MREIAAECIDREAFGGFGGLLCGASDTLKTWNGRTSAAPVIEMLDVAGSGPASLHVVTMLERHPMSTQAFFPICVEAYLVVVAPQTPDGRPDVSALRAFHVPGSTAVQYGAAVWHAPIAVLNSTGRFAMHVHKDGSLADCEFIDIPPVAVRLEIIACKPVPAAQTGVTPDPSEPTPDRSYS